MRSIVDESDKLYYDNVAKQESLTNTSIEASSEVDEKQLNNFKAESMESLETSDPWLESKNRM